MGIWRGVYSCLFTHTPVCSSPGTTGSPSPNWESPGAANCLWPGVCPVCPYMCLSIYGFAHICGPYMDHIYGGEGSPQGLQIASGLGITTWSKHKKEALNETIKSTIACTKSVSLHSKEAINEAILSGRSLYPTKSLDGGECSHKDLTP